MSGKVAADNGETEEMMMMDTVDRSGKYGPPREFDPKFKGPIEERGCTDVICLLLFIAYLIGWGVVAVIAFRQGDPSVLVNPVDSWGQKCGLDPNVVNKSYLYFFDITKCASPKVLITGCRTPQICIEKCPDYGPWAAESAMLKREPVDEIKSKMICKYGVDKSSKTVEELLKQKLCATYVLPAQSIARRCIPNSVNIEEMEDIKDVVKVDQVSAGVKKLIEFINAKQNVEYMFEDLRASWHVIVLLLVIGATASLIWICLMRCFAGIMVWLSLIGTIGVLGFSCYYSVVKYIDLKNRSQEVVEELRSQDVKMERFITEEINSGLDTYLKLKDTWLVFAISSGVILAILLFVILVIRSRLSIAIALIKQGARAVGDMLFTLFWPLTPWVMQLVGIGFFVSVGLYLVSANEKVYHITQNCTCAGEILIEEAKCTLSKFLKQCGAESDCVKNEVCQFSMYQKLSNVGYLHMYNFIGITWLLCFISDFGDMVLAGSFAGWYWTLDRKKDLVIFPVSTSFLRTIRYHLGTVAFGSLIITIIKFIRYFIEWVDYKLKQYNENPFAKAILCCCRCFFWCLEKFMKFINRNAYIMTAVYGKNFCTAAKDAFFLLMRNALRAFVLDKVTDFLLFMGKLVIVGGVAVASFFYFSGGITKEENAPELHFYLMPVIVITVGTYFIATLFFSVYNMAVDTLFLCFLEDCERNDGSLDKPYYMPKELMVILGKKNQMTAAVK